jgi:DNA-binding NtrC family response regulator
MTDTTILRGKKILIVDDEPDILETLVDILDMCFTDTAQNFESAKTFLEEKEYDAAIFDIMGVNGYELLTVAKENNIPALMLTAHALNPLSLVKSIKSGARAYLPKDKMIEIDVYLADLLMAVQKGIKKSGGWFAKLKPFFDDKFGPGWKENDKAFWEEFDKEYLVTKGELRSIL